MLLFLIALCIIAAQARLGEPENKIPEEAEGQGERGLGGYGYSRYGYGGGHGRGWARKKGK